MTQQVKDTLAMLLIGDGILSLLRPKRHVWLWSNGPEGYQEAMKALAERPAVTGLIAAAEVSLGLLLAHRTEE